jgi:hypothetical protein
MKMKGKNSLFIEAGPRQRAHNSPHARGPSTLSSPATMPSSASPVCHPPPPVLGRCQTLGPSPILLHVSRHCRLPSFLLSMPCQPPPLRSTPRRLKRGDGHRTAILPPPFSTPTGPRAPLPHLPPCLVFEHGRR